MSPFDPNLISQFGPDAKAWVFTLARALSSDELSLLSAKVNNFLSTWTAHKQELKSSMTIVDSQVLVVAADMSASGCSIDALFTEISKITAEMGLTLAPLGTAVVRHGDRSLRIFDRSGLREAFKNNEINLSSEVLNSVALKVSELESGLFQKLEDSPYVRLLK